MQMDRFRSRVAAAYFKKINKNKKIKVKSAGLFKGSFISKRQIAVAKKSDLNIKGGAKAISTRLLKWQDIIVVVADDVPTSIFNNKKYGKKIIVWKIADVKGSDKTEEREKEIIKQIMEKIDKLNEQLERVK